MKTFGITFWYAILCFGFVVILFLEISFIGAQITSVDETSTKVNSDVGILESRIKTLRSVKPIVTEAISKSTNALPSNNSSLIVVSQIRHLATNHEVELKNISLTNLPLPENADLGTIQVNFTSVGSLSNTLLFLDDLGQAAPLLSFDTLNMLANIDHTTTQISLLSFWSPYPTRLPNLSDPLQSLSENEDSLLTSLKSLKEPVLTTASESSEVSGVSKTNPFSEAK